jgi:hypothetical protein
MQVRGNESYQRKGWTIVLLERASRFIWERRCGRKDRKLFKRAIPTLVKVINTTGDLALITDGEQSSGQVVFELCSELLRTGKRGRPPRPCSKAFKFASKTRAHTPLSAAASGQTKKEKTAKAKPRCLLDPP